VNRHLATVLLAMCTFVVPIAGRFVFTPILPLMQSDFGVSIVAAGWLAAANHLGYLGGALTAVRLPFSERATLRVGLIGVVLSIAAMGAVSNVQAWFVLRLVAGVAAAWLFVYTSAWGLRHAMAAQRPHWSAFVFAGSGLGIIATGVLCAFWTLGGGGAAGAWLANGMLLAALSLVVWKHAGDEGVRAPKATAAAEAGSIPGIRRFIFAYGLCGFGYVTAATFLPVLARQVLGEASGYVWFWPMFGIAALMSTFLAARLGERFGDITAFRACAALMALGNAAMALLSAGWALAFGTVAIGGTFMVATMLGLREVRRRAPANATQLIGHMTIAWAVGQCIGPVVSAYLAGAKESFALALWVAAAATALACVVTPPRMKA
jgi:predicted MFS family arabinose efflux permease